MSKKTKTILQKKFIIVVPILFFSLLIVVLVLHNQQLQDKPVEQESDNSIEKIVENDLIDAVDCTNLTEEEAIEKVKQLPEVKRYLGYFYDEPRTAHPSKEPRIEIDREDNNSYIVHVHEIDVSGEPYIGTTFNWYTVDKCTGEIICSFTIYDEQGELVRVSEADECN